MQKSNRNRVYIIMYYYFGIGGKTYTKEHIKGTARVVNASSPHYLGTLTLILETGVKEEFLTKFGEEFHPINDDEALTELRDLVQQIDGVLARIRFYRFSTGIFYGFGNNL